MAAERISMRQIREILRQKWVLKKSHRAVCESVGVSSGAVSGLLARATVTGLDWSHVLPRRLDDGRVDRVDDGHHRRRASDVGSTMAIIGRARSSSRPMMVLDQKGQSLDGSRTSSALVYPSRAA